LENAHLCWRLVSTIVPGLKVAFVRMLEPKRALRLRLVIQETLRVDMIVIAVVLKNIFCVFTHTVAARSDLFHYVYTVVV
jgi:hypothetical protein